MEGDSMETSTKLIIAGAAAGLAFLVGLPLLSFIRRVEFETKPEVQALRAMGKNLEGHAEESTEVAAACSMTLFDQGSWKDPNPYSRSNPGYYHFAIDVEFKNGSTKVVTTNPFDFTLQDTANRSYRTTFGGPKPSYTNRPLQGGESARGWLCFELANGETPIKLIHTIGIMGAKVEVPITGTSANTVRQGNPNQSAREFQPAPVAQEPIRELTLEEQIAANQRAARERGSNRNEARPKPTPIVVKESEIRPPRPGPGYVWVNSHVRQDGTSAGGYWRRQ
jgi:hypothetical protein